MGGVNIVNEILFRDNTNGKLEVRRTLMNDMRYIEYLYEDKVFSWLYEEEPLRDSFILSSVIFSLYNDSNRVLILGGGCGSYAILLNQLRPDLEITLVDINPLTSYLAREYFGLADLKNAEYITIDAYEYLKANKRKYDLILVDVFDNTGIPKAFTDVSFFKTVFNSLEQNGVFVMNTNMKTVPSIENAFPNLINPLHFIVDRMKKAGFSTTYESRLTNSSLLISFKIPTSHKIIRDFFLSLIENHCSSHVQAVAYGMLMRVETIKASESTCEEQQLSQAYKKYVKRVIYSLYRYHFKTSTDCFDKALQDLYLRFIFLDIKNSLYENFDDLFDVTDSKYYEAIYIVSKNRNLSFDKFYDMCRYISVGRSGNEISLDQKNPFVYFMKGIYFLRNDCSEKALPNFASMKSLINDIRDN